MPNRVQNETDVMSFVNLLTYLRTPSSEANQFAASQEIPPILWKSKVHYHFTSARHLSLS
jgi:hypothetical protein